MVGPKLRRRFFEEAQIVVRGNGAAQPTLHCKVHFFRGWNMQILWLQRGCTLVLKFVDKFDVRSSSLSRSLASCDADSAHSHKLRSAQENRIDKNGCTPYKYKPAKVPANYPGKPTANFNSNVCPHFELNDTTTKFRFHTFVAALLSTVN